jgi:ABC-2 type transport system permease protein
VNGTVFSLTLREFASQRRSLLILLLALVPVGLAALFQAGEGDDPQDFTANFLLDGVVIARVLPLACLIVGTAAIGTEIEDGTIVYLLAKPAPRRAIVLAKFAAAALISGVLIVPATLISGRVALGDVPGEGVVVGFTAAALVGTLAYTAVFVALSIATSRALLAGLAYVFIWEGLVASLFGGVAYLSIRHYCLGIADSVATLDTSVFEAKIGGVEGLVLAALVTAGALWLAVSRLERLELGEAE